eukprot:s264_g2.t1
MGKNAQVRNKSANPNQITAEQLLREAVDRQQEEAVAPKQRIADEDELMMYKVRKRKEFEDVIRRQRQNIGSWVKYAQWEASQQEFRRARSIFERALHVEYQNVSLWLKYLEMEMKNKFVNHARNLFDRVVQLLPRVDQFWYKYAYMEELLANYAGARTIYERWMEWEPDDNPWLQYVKFEERCGELDKARKVLERYVSCRPTQQAFLRLCKFEEKHNNAARARSGFEKSVELLGQELDEKFYIKFAQFEQRQREMERAQAIFKLALDILPKGASDELYRAYVSFEKQHGDRDAIEEVVINKRRFIYEEAIVKNPRNYDVWFDYVRLEESVGDVTRIRETYERAVGNKPPVMQKRFWRRYIYLWIYFALFEELQTGDIEKARAVYDALLKVVPHKQFSFAKIWKLYAEFEVRQLELDRARRIYGRAIAECQKERIFLDYADLEMRLGNIDRCRTIYGKFLEVHPHNPKAWTVYVDLEDSVGEIERARALCNLAVNQERLDMPELVWKRFIDLEVSQEQLDNARKVWQQLLGKSHHVRVYIAYSDFEAVTCQSMEKAREALDDGQKHFKVENRNEERAMLLEHLLKLEREHGDDTSIEAAEKRQPKREKKRLGKFASWTYQLELGVCRDSLAAQTLSHFGWPKMALERFHALLQEQEGQKTDGSNDHTLALPEDMSCTTFATHEAPELLDEGHEEVADPGEIVMEMMSSFEAASDILRLKPRDVPPAPLCAGASILYTLILREKVLYIGQSDNLQNRLQQHRQRFGERLEAVLLMPVENTSTARQLETQLQRQCLRRGMTLESSADALHRNFPIKDDMKAGAMPAPPAESLRRMAQELMEMAERLDAMDEPWDR